jgi:transposase InsO family protein
MSIPYKVHIHEAFVEFKKFRIKAKKHSGQTLKILRTYGRGEYNSIEFKNFYEENVIEHEVTAPYTPKHNGLIERRNQTLLDMIRSMLKEKKLPNTLWEKLLPLQHICSTCIQPKS